MQGEWDWMGKMPSLGSVLGGQQDTANMPLDDSMAQLETQRKLKLAQALQNQQNPEGQMISGHYVAPSWTQYLNTGVRNYQGQKKEQEAIKGYGEYQQAKQKRLADALQDLNKDTGPKAITQDSTYQIQIPNGQAPQTENLGGMQPVQTGTKTIDVPMTQTTGQRMPTAAERDAAMYKFATATQNPELMSKVAMGRIEKQDQSELLNAQRQYEKEQLNNKRQYDELLHKRDRGEKLTDTETANLFALDKMHQEQGFQAGQNALNRGVTIRGQDISQANVNKPPTGYRWDTSGQLVAIKGGPADKALNPTEAQSNANLFGTRAAESNRILQKLDDKYSPAGIQFQESAIGNLPGVSYVTNKALSPATQQAAQAQRDFVTAILRKESGAAISASEFDNARKQYFAQPGDSPAVKAQKAANRELAIKGIQSSAGPLNNQQPQVRTVDW